MRELVRGLAAFALAMAASVGLAVEAGAETVVTVTRDGAPLAEGTDWTYDALDIGAEDLPVLLAGLDEGVNLSKDVIDYSDLGLSNPYNTRLMVTEALSADGLTLTDDYDPSLPPAYGDEDQLIQIFLNLVKNRLKLKW